MSSNDALDETLRARLLEALRRSSDSLERTARDWPCDRPAPIWTEKGRWFRQPEMWTDWTPGFFAGQMWILAKLLGSDAWRARAESYTLPLAERRFDREVHDLGFIFLSSWGRWLETLDAGDPLRRHILDTMVTAATVQSFRWNGSGEHGFIYSFNGPQSLFIDVMMNVRLLFFAHPHGASDEVRRRALEHSRTSARYLVRRSGPELGAEDGCVIHEAIFNTERGRGEFRCLSTQQGYSPFTCWSRGLGWALYGFAYAYGATGEADLLEVAERCAAFYLRKTPAHGVPPWDYGAPGAPDTQLDASSAAIIGCGLFELAKHTGDEARREKYVTRARALAGTLVSDAFFGPSHAGEEGLLVQSVYHLPRGWGVGAATMWGDYFLLELIERALESA